MMMDMKLEDKTLLRVCERKRGMIQVRRGGKLDVSEDQTLKRINDIKQDTTDFSD